MKTSSPRGLISAVLLLGSLITIPAHAGGALYSQSFNTSPPALVSYVTGTGVTVATTYTTDGTVDTYCAHDGETPAYTTAATLSATCAATTSAGWRVAMNIPRVMIPAPGTADPSFFTLSFDASPSLSRPFRVVVRSYATATSAESGYAYADLTPPIAGSYFRHTIELNKFTISTGFKADDPYFSVSFELLQTAGWPNSSVNTLKVDNIAYATPKYYVNSAALNSSGNGLTETTPFKTLSAAANVVAAGDVVCVMAPPNAPQYTSTNGSLMNLVGKSGSPAAWIMLRAYPGQAPVIKVSNWAGIGMGLGSAYIEIRDLQFIGTRNDSNVTLQGGTDDGQLASPSGIYNGVGITANGRSPQVYDPVSGRNQAADETTPDIQGPSFVAGNRYRSDRPHHIRVINCDIGDCTQAGFATIMADYVTIADCNIISNSYYTRYGSSGISLLDNWRFDNLTKNKIFILNNHVFDNRTKVIANAVGKRSDGNGIIIDDSLNTQAGSLGVKPAWLGGVDVTGGNRPYTGRTLVQNNLCVNNGAAGIHIWRSQTVDVVNNTTYYNNAEDDPANGVDLNYGEITTARSPSNRLYNNIMWGRPGKRITQDVNENRTARSGSNYGYNTYWNAAGATGLYWNPGATPLIDFTAASFVDDQGRNTQDKIADPLLTAPSIDPLNSNFELQAASPALNNGLDGIYTRRSDIDGMPRPVGAVDRGAYER